MCFSAEASIGAGTVLAVAGVLSLRKVSKPSQFLFACVPFLFSIQQFSEGVVWLSLTDLEMQHWQQLFTSIFVFFAQVLWPFWVPLSILLIEKKEKRKKLIFGFLVAGGLVAVYHLYCMCVHSYSAITTPYHIRYLLEFPLNHNTVFSSFYAAAILLPPFISSLKGMKLLGVFSMGSFLVTAFYYKDDIISVWCFFAALISWTVYVVMKKLKEAQPD